VFHDPRLIAALRVLISDIRRSVAPAVAEARFFQTWDMIDGEESPWEQCRRENADGLRYMAEFGNARGSAAKAARRISPNNLRHQLKLAKRFQRLQRTNKK
jgi:hypothetical protein